MNYTFESITELLTKAMLSDREVKVLSMRLTGSTLGEIGAFVGVTRERVRQIEAKAIRKLKHPTRWGGVENRLKPKKELLIKTVYITGAENQIEELDLPCRIHNALMGANYRKISEIDNASDLDLWKCRKIGKQTILYVRQKIEEWKATHITKET